MCLLFNLQITYLTIQHRRNCNNFARRKKTHAEYSISFGYKILYQLSSWLKKFERMKTYFSMSTFKKCIFVARIWRTHPSLFYCVYFKTIWYLKLCLDSLFYICYSSSMLPQLFTTIYRHLELIWMWRQYQFQTQMTVWNCSCMIHQDKNFTMNGFQNM